MFFALEEEYRPASLSQTPYGHPRPPEESALFTPVSAWFGAHGNCGSGHVACVTGAAGHEPAEWGTHGARPGAGAETSRPYSSLAFGSSLGTTSWMVVTPSAPMTRTERVRPPFLSERMMPVAIVIAVSSSQPWAFRAAA